MNTIDTDTLTAALRRANAVCRSLGTIAARNGERTNWAAVTGALSTELEHQHAILYPVPPVDTVPVPQIDAANSAPPAPEPAPEWPLGINEEIDGYAARLGLGHWICITLDECGWVRRDGRYHPCKSSIVAELRAVDARYPMGPPVPIRKRADGGIIIGPRPQAGPTRHIEETLNVCDRALRAFQDHVKANPAPAPEPCIELTGHTDTLREIHRIGHGLPAGTMAACRIGTTESPSGSLTFHYLKVTPAALKALHEATVTRMIDLLGEAVTRPGKRLPQRWRRANAALDLLDAASGTSPEPAAK